MDNLLDQIGLKNSIKGHPRRQQRFNTPTRSTPFPESLTTPDPQIQEDLTTTEQEPPYPSPQSDNFFDNAEITTSSSNATKTSLSRSNDVILESNDSSTSTHEPSSSSTKSDPLTLSIVHYRPNGIISGRRKRRSSSGVHKTENPKCSKNKSSSGELKIRMMKWDRISDKGTAPLNVEPRSTGPRACTLCSLAKRKVFFPHEKFDTSVIEQMVNVLMKHILALLVKRAVSSVNLLLRHSCVRELQPLQRWRV